MYLPNKLEILLITYNRCEYLQSTITALESSPFRECHITVVDNCSTDATSNVVNDFINILPKLTYIKNRLNIGGNPNYLKAIELSSSDYTWILCDDDFYDFSECDDVINAIESDRFDLIEVGATEKGAWPRGTATSAQELIKSGIDYHFRFSFFPAYVFRTALFDSVCFCWGYKNIDRLYPQFEFLNKSVRENFSVYLAKKRIITRNEVNDHSFFPFAWYAAWVSCCRTISDKSERSRAIDAATADRGFYKSVGFWSILDRNLNKDGMFWLRVAEIFQVFNGVQRLKFLLILSATLLPLPFSFWAWMRLTIYRIMGTPSHEIPPICFKDRG